MKCSKYCKTCLNELNKNKLQAVGVRYNNWEVGQTIKIAFIGGSDYEINLTKQRIAEAKTFVNLDFQYTENLQDSDVRIGFDKTDGAWSYVAKDALSIPKSMPTMNLGFLDGGTIQHEISHIIGQQHEQQFPNWLVFNEQVVIADMKQHGWDEATTRFNILDKINPNTVDTSESADQFSVMMYWINKSWVKLPIDFNPRNNITWSIEDRRFLSAKFPYETTEPTTPTENNLYQNAYQSLTQAPKFKDLTKKTLLNITKGFAEEKEPFKNALINWVKSGMREVVKLSEETLIGILTDLGEVVHESDVKDRHFLSIAYSLGLDTDDL